MPEDSTTPDPVELTRGYIETANRRDFDAIESLCTQNVVLRGEMIGTFEGRPAVRGYWEDMHRPYDQLRGEAEQILDLGFGVAFVVTVARGRLVGSSADVRIRYASVLVWSEGLVERQMNYMDIDEARTAGERLAEERG